VLGPAQVGPYISQLKAARAWVDAYSLWVALHRRTLPMLYNGGFDQAFQQDGFDWELPPQGNASRAGALVERTGAGEKGAALDIRFTGRAIALPLVRQNLFLGQGRYRLRGEYKVAQLRMEQGLAWVVRCTAAQTASPAGRSGGLRDTGAWQPFEFEFSIPEKCGWVASLQLETSTPYEATVGSRGRASFTGLSLEKLER
jgi:hypothetical protein